MIALKEDGTVIVWGDNTFDQCTVPTNLANVKAVSSTGSHVVALKEDGTVVAWGFINLAELYALSQLSDIKAIDVGLSHTLAIKKNGTVIALGNNSYGQCIVPSEPSSFKAIATGKNNAFALREDGTIISWGDTIYATNISWGDLYTTEFYSIKDIVVGDSHGVALRKDGSIFNWGYFCNGKQNLEPKRLSGVKAVAVGTNHVVALKEDGTIVAWGDNTYGQCSIPVGISPAKAIAAGGRHTLAIKEDGTIIAWGDNTYGQCSIPANLSGVKTIASGDLYSVALKEDDTVISWGSNKYGQCNVPANLTSVKAIAAGANHIVALKEDGTVIAWGDNSEGQFSIPAEILPVKAIYAGNSNTILLGKDGKVTGLGWDFIIPFPKYIPTNFIAPSAAEFDPSGTGDIAIGIGKDSSKLLAVKNGSASLNNNDYSISGNTVTIKKSYLSYFFNKFNLPGVKLNLTFDFEDGNDTVLTVTRAAVSNSISCSNPNFDSSNPQDIIFNITGSAIKAIKNSTASLNSNDYSISGNTVTIKKSYLSYFFTKFNMSWAKLNLTFDFESGNDPLFTVSPVQISNFATCETPVFDLSNPQDIKVNISGNSLTAIKNGAASLSSNDYSISGNTVTIKKSYLSYFFNRFTAPGQKLTLTLDFEKGNDPLFTVTRTQNSNNLTSFIGMVKTVIIEGQTVTLTKDVNGVSTEIVYPVETLSDDLKTDSKTATTSAVAVNTPITWNNFAINDMQGIAGDKTSADPQHRIYRFYINTNNKITKIERLDFSTDIIPTKFNKTSNCIDTTGSSLYINNNTLFFDLKDNKVVYWKDFDDNSIENVALKAGTNANSVSVAAFVNDTYKNISNSLACNNPTFDPSNPQDIFINMTTANVAGNKSTAIKNGTASLNSNDYSISGNTVTIKKSYLSYFFNRFTAPWQKLTLTFDFEKCNDPIFTVSRSSSNLTSFMGMVMAVRIQGQAVTLIKDVNGISTYADYSVKVDSNDFNLGSTSAGAVNVPITWNNFVTNDMQGIAGDKTSTNDPQHRIYKFYVNDDNRIVRIERINFGSNINPIKFSADVDSIETSNGRLFIDGTTFFDLKDNSVRYWKDIEGKSVSKVVLQAGIKANGADVAVVAFVNDTYKYVDGADTSYAYIKYECCNDPYYVLTTGIGDTLKVHKDDIYQFKQIDKQFISYTKDGDKNKIKTVTKAVYNSGYISPLVVQNDTTDSTATVYTAYGIFDNKDGSTINVYAQGGTDSNGCALTAGTMYSFKLDPQVKVTKLTINDSGDIDTASIQYATDIVKGDKVGLVIIDGIVRMIYYKR